MKYPETSELAKAARARTGKTQQAFGMIIHTSKRAIADWEAGEKEPNGAAETLLMALRDGRITIDQLSVK